LGGESGELRGKKKRSPRCEDNARQKEYLYATEGCGTTTMHAKFLEGQANVSAFETEDKRHGGHVAIDTYTLDSSMFIAHIFNSVHQ
jgi:hypothetical protein